MGLYEFRLPKYSQLTDSQKIAVNEVNPIALSGAPGTGKSVVSVWRHLYNTKNGKKSLLLTYTKTLSKSLELVCRSEGNNKAAANVSRTQLFQYNNKGVFYDEIIVDEAQDMPCDFYHQINSRAQTISYGADGSQILYPDKACNIECFKTKFSSKRYSTKSVEEVKERCLQNIFEENEPAPLDRNYRNTYEIMSFVKSLFPERAIPISLINDLKNDSDKRGPKPVYHIINTLRGDYTENQNSYINKILEEYHSDGHNIALLVPFQNNVDDYFKVVKDLGYECSSYKSDYEDIDDIKNIHVTTFKSAKGLEFDTVIIPDFEKIRADLKKYNITENDYYVAVTKERKNLYLVTTSTMINFDSNLVIMENSTSRTTSRIQPTRIVVEDSEDLPPEDDEQSDLPF